jgi:hypothetical protein
VGRAPLPGERHPRLGTSRACQGATYSAVVEVLIWAVTVDNPSALDAKDVLMSSSGPRRLKPQSGAHWIARECQF